jgi:cell division protein FtsN
MTDVAHSTAAPAPEEDVTTTLYRAAIGPVSTAYYLPIFTRFEAAEHAGISWNHAASLLTLNWLIFRQLWLAALGYAAILLTLALLVFGIGRLVFDFSDAMMTALGLGFGLAAFVLPGLFGNALLHGECRKRMSKALATHADVADACTELWSQASTRKRIISLAAVNTVLALLAGWIYLQFSLTVAPQGAVDAVEPGHVAVGHTVDLTVPPGLSAATSTSASAPLGAPTSATAVMQSSAPASASGAISTASASTPAAAASALAPPASATSTLPAATVPLAGVPSNPGSAPQAVRAPASATSSISAVSTAPAVSAVVASRPTTPASAIPKSTASATQLQSSAPTALIAPRASAPKRAEAPVKPVAQERPPKEARKPRPASTPATQQKPYFINVGLFAVPDNAENAHAKLLEAHLPSVTKELKSAKGPLTRVRVGPFATEDEANAAVVKIKALQLDAVIVQP